MSDNNSTSDNKSKKHPERLQPHNGPDDRKKLFDLLCKHVSAGYSMDSFYFCSKNCLDSMLVNYKDEFDMSLLETAKNKGRFSWETIGMDQSTGKCLGNSRSWYYNMANRYGWSDRSRVETESKGEIKIEIMNYGSK